LILVHNFDERPYEIRIKAASEADHRLVNLLVNDESRADGQGNHKIALEAYGYRWFRVGDLNYSLQQTRV
jgi:maltose alpha-D-glucosyltransferase/alpha-amylase